MRLVRPFDPWRSPLCTCPAKYVLHPYTGCGHRCLYCYASSYIRDFFSPRPKEEFWRRLSRDLELLPAGSLVELSTSSDPYTPPEERLSLTRRALAELLGRGFRVLVTTKSSLVLRDLDVLLKYRDRVAVTVTITTLDERVAAALEPGAPAPAERLRAVSVLSRSGVPTLVRVDPVVPHVNDDPSALERLVEQVSRAGALQVTSSTYKARPDSLSRLLRAFPEVAPRIAEAYRSGERVGGYAYLRRSARYEYMKTVREASLRAGLAFNTCREGFPELATRGFNCDGSSLIGRTGSAATL